MSWQFYLVGNKYDRYIQGEIENSRPHGERNLVHKQANYRVYVLTWSDVTTSFELRHNFVLEKLRLERARLTVAAPDADGVLVEGADNAAILPGVELPSLATSVV